jgi:hypothetical protein
MPFILWQ